MPAEEALTTLRSASRSLPGPRSVRVAYLRRAIADGGPAVPHALIVTGISRSGTSHLCNLLHRYDNCVAVNEPHEVIRELRRRRVPWGVPLFYRDTRRAISKGASIENKLLGGEVVEDTARYQVRHRYTPAVADEDFVLAVKNTREFLCRLEAVRRVMPATRVVACVRNPVDTIASWKGSFAHLRDADIPSFLGDPRRPWLSETQQRELERIAAVADPAVRRASWWRFFAVLVLRARAEIVVVDYDELVRDPMTVLGRILRDYRPGELRRPVSPAIPHGRRDLLGEDDWRAIQAICAETAAELDLDVPDR